MAQQNNGPKPWFKVPKVCPGHLDALKQPYLVKTPICQKPGFRKINLYPYSTGHLEQKMILFGFFHQQKYTKH